MAEKEKRSPKLVKVRTGHGRKNEKESEVSKGLDRTWQKKRKGVRSWSWIGQDRAEKTNQSPKFAETRKKNGKNINRSLK